VIFGLDRTGVASGLSDGLQRPGVAQPHPASRAARGPLIAAYVLILGLRIAFDLPASVAAAWIFRAILNPGKSDAPRCQAGCLQLCWFRWCCLPTLAFFWWRWNLPSRWDIRFTCWRSRYVLSSCCSLATAKIPLTCPVPGFRDNFLLLCLIQFFALNASPGWGPAPEHWMFVEPARFLLLPGSMLAAWLWNKRRPERRAGMRASFEPGLDVLKTLLEGDWAADTSPGGA